MKIYSLDDGVYFISEGTKVLDLGYLELSWDFEDEEDSDDENIIYLVRTQPLSDYIKEKHNINWERAWLANAYATGCVFVLNKEPIPLSSIGSGFNYGSTNIIEVHEKGRVLILAEDD